MVANDIVYAMFYSSIFFLSIYKLQNMVYLRINEPQERDAELMRDSLFGWNKVNLNVLIELLCTRSSSQLSSIKQAYCNRYGSNIEQDVSQKISGNFKEVLCIRLLKVLLDLGGRAPG